MGLGCLDVPERGCERLGCYVCHGQARCFRKRVRRAWVGRSTANYLRRKRTFHACSINFLKLSRFLKKKRDIGQKMANFESNTCPEIYKNRGIFCALKSMIDIHEYLA